MSQSVGGPNGKNYVGKYTGQYYRYQRVGVSGGYPSQGVTEADLFL